MTEGDRTDGSDDLFEDLDKFFEPIQDLGWPTDEPDPGAAATPPPAEPEPAPAPEVVEVEVEVDEVDEGTDVADVPSVLVPEAETQEDTQSFVFGWEDEGLTGFELDEDAGRPAHEPVGDEELSLTEQFAAADEEAAEEEAAAVVQIEDEDAVIVEEIEEPGLGSFAPGPEGEVELSDETEAAADHFASSVRPDPPEPEDVEAAILSDLEASSADDEELVRVAAPEGLQGPSWQEPTHEEVGEDQGQPLGRNVPAAFVTGFAMAAVAIVALLVSEDLFEVLAGAVIILGQVEFYAAVRKRHFDPATAIGLVFGVLALGGAYLKGEAALLAMIPLALVFCVFWEMATPSKFRRNVLVNIAITMLGFLYIPVLAGFAMVILSVPEVGVSLIFWVLALTFVYDTAAFVIGSLWGDTQLAPSISPRKSVQGAVAATVIVIGLSVAAVSSIDGVGFGGAVALALIVSIFAPLGDLAESLFKRDLGIKDMGSILPGHGGILDRIDSVLFVAPAALLLFRALF